MVIVTTDFISGQEIETIKAVTGSMVMTKNIGRDLAAGFKSMAGGELKGYTEMLTDARVNATNRMIEDAMSVGADGIINVRYTTSSITQGASEVLAYGTAVKFKR